MRAGVQTLKDRRSRKGEKRSHMDKIERVKRELKFHGKIVDFYQDTVRLPDGREAIWDLIDHKGAAAVVPVREDGKILMVRQYRSALDRFTLELPAGAKNGREEPAEVCAARELEEETGYACRKLTHLIDVNTTVAFCTERIGVFLAEDLVKTQQHLDDDEYVEPEAWELDDLLEKIYAGEMTDGKTIAGLCAYAVKRMRGEA